MLQKKLRFVAASFLDWWMTVMLIGQHIFYENNPVANGFYENWGYLGLLCYKLPPFIVVFAVVLLIYARGHRKIAYAVLDWGTAVTVGVVLYGFCLFVSR